MNLKILLHLKINSISNNKKDYLITIWIPLHKEIIIKVSGKLGWKLLKSFHLKDQWGWMMWALDFKKK